MSAPGPARAAASTRDDWETPDALWRPLHEEFGFTLDAAAHGGNAKCSRFLSGPCTGMPCPLAVDGACYEQMALGKPCCDGWGWRPDSCGLCASYAGEMAWCNPPYGPGLANWTRTWARQADSARGIVALLPANTDTAWFADVYEHAAELRFLRGRVNFVGSTSGNTGGNVIAIYRPTVPGLRRPAPVMTLWDWRGH